MSKIISLFILIINCVLNYYYSILIVYLYRTLKLKIMKTSIIITVVYSAIIIASLVGEVKCIIKMINCNWEPIGKAEIIYTAGTFTGLGCIVGYLDIKDN